MGNANSNRRLHTTHIDEYGKEVSVGALHHPAVARPHELWPAAEHPYVFISHTDLDHVKYLIGWPTRWFLREKLGVKVWLDDGDAENGVQTSLAVLKPAHRCTHALVLFSPRFRQKKFPVMEVNLFVERMKDPKFKLIPFLWGTDSLKGYAPALQETIFTKSKHFDPAGFMIRQLWPDLLKRFAPQLQPESTESYFIQCLLTYVERHRGVVPIPPDLEAFCRRNELRSLILDVKPSRPKDSKSFDVFISHTGRDHTANRLATKLFEELTVRKPYCTCFLDSSSLSVGEDWEESITNAATNSKFFVVLLSRSYFHRHWTMKELDLAMSRNTRIFPVLVDDEVNLSEVLDDDEFLRIHGRMVGQTASRWLGNAKKLLAIQALRLPQADGDDEKSRFTGFFEALELDIREESGTADRKRKHLEEDEASDSCAPNKKASSYVTSP